MSQSRQYRAKAALLYEKVTQLIRDSIEKGTLKPGEKIPSVRKLSKQLGVSIATVVQAYAILESQGFIESRERSGYIVLPLQTAQVVQPGKTQPSMLSKRVSLNSVVVNIAEMADSPDKVPLGAATLSPKLSPVKELKQISASVIRHADEWAFFYEFVPGNEALIQQLAKRSIQWGCNLADEDFVITSGAMEALQLALRVVAKAGDVIAVESPTFYPILQTLENLGMYALEIPTDPRDGIDIDMLEAMLQKEPIKACILIPNFNNPLGYMMPESHKRRLVEMMAEKQIPIIEDDVYTDLYLGSSRPLPLKAFDREGLVLTCSTFSKTLCSGFRVGWIAPGRFKQEVRRLKHFTNVATPTLSQLVLAECLKSGLYDKHVARLRVLFKNQLPLYLNAISRYFPSGTKVTSPQGGFMFWLELPETFDSLKFYRACIDKGISIAPGPMFSAVHDYKNCIRLSGGHPWTDQTDETLKLLGELSHAFL